MQSSDELFFGSFEKYLSSFEGNAMECKHSNGFTLIEFLVAAAIILILLTTAIPSFVDLVRANRLSTQLNYFVTAVNFARNEAIKRNVRVTLCVNRGGDCDAGKHWEQGWLVFDDKNGNAKVEQNELIRLFAPLTAGYTLRPNLNVSRLVYHANSDVRKVNGAWPMMTVRLCAPDAADGNLSQRSREVRINATGRMRLQVGREIVGAC
jgi:type IV fimbrial biogenesis protein FimT